MSSRNRFRRWRREDGFRDGGRRVELVGGRRGLRARGRVRAGRGGASARASSSWRRMAICDTAALRSSRGFGAAASLGLSRAGPAALIASSRRTASISACRSPSRAAFERSRISATNSNARAARASARESLASKRSIAESKEFRNPWCSRSARASFRRAMRSRRPAAASSRSSSASLSSGRRRSNRPARRSLRPANRQAACRRDGRLPQRRPEFAAPRPRSSTPSLCSCPRPSPAAANRRALQGRGTGQLFRRSW